MPITLPRSRAPLTEPWPVMTDEMTARVAPRGAATVIGAKKRL